MAQISFNEEQNPVIQNESFEGEQSIIEQPVETPIAIEEKTLTTEGTAKGLSQEEINDPNNISVTIADKDAPIVVLFGPPQCGKTMTLVRLSRYLKRQGYTLQPVRTFRPAADNNYKELCDNFSTIVNSDDAASRTDNISFMLVQVIKNGKVICQILEGPGELYFNPTKAHQEFPTYVPYLFNDADLRKIFVFFVEPNFMDPENRSNYVSTLGQVQQSTDKQKHIFLYNKIDLINDFVLQSLDTKDNLLMSSDVLKAGESINVTVKVSVDKRVTSIDKNLERLNDDNRGEISTNIF